MKLNSSQQKIAASLDLALQAAGSPEFAQKLQRYFADQIVSAGVPNQGVVDLVAAAHASFGGASVEDWLAVADVFAQRNEFHEHMILASAIVSKVVRKIKDEGQLLLVFERWLGTSVNNWAQCDDMCIKPIYLYLKRRPHLLAEVVGWGKSDKPWVKRASNVALVKFVGRSEAADLNLVLANCQRLLRDEDVYVQKGIGWVLKVAAQYQPEPVLAFLRQHLAEIERSTLRYALEKMPEGLRREIMRAEV
ncbi:DNA alkylation repair protein [Roseateles sp. BYS180W]|uniref:DNA alkylation repair protein n=1 Tax=Roseateles rivi TaxID=3299028 RepID=A0ABW7FTG6_9BURK